MFDIKSYLNYAGVTYKTNGKNVGSSDVNICCPFCQEHRYHLGINKTNAYINCWVCRFDNEERRPNIIRLIMALEEITYARAKATFDKFSYDSDEEICHTDAVTKVYLPDEAESFGHTTFTRQRDLAVNYLSSRGFGWECIRQHKLKFCPNGDYAYRIIIPVYRDGILVTYTGRDYSWKSDIRYLNCPIRNSICTPKHTLYGLDDFVGDHLRVVEGVTDKWRLVNIAVAMMSGKMSREQRQLIIPLKLDSLSIILDPGNLKHAYMAAEDLSPFIDKVKVVELEGGDVANHTKDQILEVERDTHYIEF